MLRRLIALILVAALSAVIFCGCKSEDDENGKLRIVTAIFPAYDFARQVFGDTAEVTLLLKPRTESHSYDPSAKDIVKINNCDLFIYNGGESDQWVENILSGLDEINSLRMMDSVEVLTEENENIAESDSGEDEYDEYDEHIWTSPKNAVKIVENIKNAAVDIAPEKAEFYEQNAKSYIEKINALDKRFEELLAGEKRYFVFADRFPLLYFFKEYGLNYYAAFPGCGDETEPSARTIAFLTEKLNDSDTIPVVFHIELSDTKLARTLTNENSDLIAEFHSCHNITADDFEAGESYVSLMERNYDVIENAMKYRTFITHYNG
ncbi:MAG: zinc ABC transporter substrate-binding protein [Oscillospiraceae bacterium]|nr:zinc ABC transporter substrate-binding protein [Oscillospiraceae bacterium]